MFRKFSFLVILLSVLPLGALATAHENHEKGNHEEKHHMQDMMIDHAWARPVFMAGRTGAAYFVLHNMTGHDDRLIAASTPLSKRAELHEHIHDNGVMKMREVESVDVPSGKAVTFQPGGYHVMIFDVDRVLSDSDSFPLTLEFEHAGKITVTVKVLKEAPEGHGHHKMD